MFRPAFLRMVCAALSVGLIAVTTPVHADTLADIKSRGKLTVGVEAGGTGAILSEDSSGKVVGQDADLNAVVAKGLGVELEMVETPWPGIIPALLSSRFDMIMSGMTATKARAERVNFTTPYGDASLVAATLANSPIKSPDALPGKTVGVLIGTNTLEFARKYSASLVARNLPPLTIKTYDDIPSMLVEMTNQNIDAVMLPSPIIGGYAAKRPGAFKIIKGLGDQSYFAAAIRKDDTALLAAVNAILMQAKKDGTLAAIQTKWLGAPSGPLPDAWDQP
jgi:polar amino acid transport system substrate-binding protein